MIYDCITYNGEKSLLKIRCEELKQLNVIHVLVESEFTFSGNPKPLYFAQQREEFKEYPIIYIVMDQPSSGNPSANPWVNEQRQRDACLGALQGLDDYDTVIIADVDECPRASSVIQYDPRVGCIAMQMNLYHYYLNCLAGENIWRIAKIMPWGYLKSTTPNAVRNAGMTMAMLEAGYHFGYMGGLQTMLDKFKSFSHQEEAVQRVATQEILQGKLDRLESLWNEDKFKIVPMTDLPIYVQDNQEEFRHMLYREPEQYYLRDYIHDMPIAPI